MSSVVKAVVIWLIALAIPLQGMAAVVMLACPPTMQQAWHGLGHPVEAPAALVVEAAEASPAGQHGASADHAAHSGHADDKAQGEPGQSGHDMLKCCSTTCAMAALTVAELSRQDQVRSPAPLHPLASFYLGVTPDGLDRPPKPIRA